MEQTDAVTAAEPTGIDKEAVRDEAEFFRLNQLVDGVRDCAFALVGHRPIDPRAVRMLVNRYEDVRTKALATLRDDVAAAGAGWAEPLADDASVEQVFVAAANLALWLDSALQLPGLVASYRHSLHEIGGLEERLAHEHVGIGGIGDIPPGMPVAKAAGQTGQYL